jgi:alcohol dehydrogenase
MYKLYCRIYQGIFRIASYFLPWRRPELLAGEDSLKRLPAVVKQKGVERVLIVTDAGVAALGLLETLLNGLQEEGIAFFLYDRTTANPTVDNIEGALALYRVKQCRGIIAFGGGSPMDCAKGVGARVARPGKSISQLRGALKIRKRIPPLFAVPTTAGTGSEATITAVISDRLTQEKYPVNDLVLIPQVAVLDPLLTIQLPAPLTATTGMDALCHAVEAYIGRSNTRETKDLSRQAVVLIFEWLPKAYADGADLTAREKMQQAAYYAGLAFTRAYVGYIHALAHALGALYATPHGLANALIMPHVLAYYGPAAHRQLAELAELAGVAAAGDSMAAKAGKFITAVRDLNRQMNIPDRIDGIAPGDVPGIVDRALQEANPFYPVPRILNKEDLTRIVMLVSGNGEAN